MLFSSNVDVRPVQPTVRELGHRTIVLLCAERTETGPNALPWVASLAAPQGNRTLKFGPRKLPFGV
jgi:hypothetical protein